MSGFKVPARFTIPRFIIIILFLTASIAVAEIKVPVVDDVKDVDFNSSGSSEEYPVKAVFYGGKNITGRILLGGKNSVKSPGEHGRIYPFSDVARITVKRWSGRKKGKGWIFLPSVYEVVLKNGKGVVCNGNIGYLNRIRFTADNGKGLFLYTYFYDYLEKGGWINSGRSGSETLTSVPVKGTLCTIELKK